MPLYCSTSGLAPVRWTAPEGLIGSKFSAQGDVWSFGILCVEVYMDGATPYPGNPNIMAFVTGGGIHPQPSSCPNHVYQELRRCWAFEPGERPTFDHMTDVFVLLGLANDANHGRLDTDELSDAMAMVFEHHGQSEATRMERHFMSLQASPAIGMLPGPMLLDAAHRDDHDQHGLPSGTTDTTYTIPETREPANDAANHYAIPDSHATPEIRTMDVTLPSVDVSNMPNTAYSIPETRESLNAAANHYTMPDSHTTPETPYGAVGRIDSSEQKLGRALVTATLMPQRTVGAYPGRSADAATPPQPYGITSMPQPLAATSEDLDARSLVPDADAHTTAVSSLLTGRRHPGGLVAPDSSEAALVSAQDWPPTREDSRSSLVNVKKGLYAIRPSVYEPVGKAQPTARCEASIFNWDRVDVKGHGSKVPAADKFDGERSFAAKLSVLKAELVAREADITGKNSRIRELEEQLEQSKHQAESSAESFIITKGSQVDRTDESRPTIRGTLTVPTRPRKKMLESVTAV